MQDILDELADDGAAVKTDAGWVSGNERACNNRTARDKDENGSTQSNAVSENVSGDEGRRTPREGISGHLNGRDPDAEITRLADKFPDMFGGAS